ncbi:MAG: O-antigen ligase family protein [Chitinophagaceae bacterium]
MKRSLKKQVTEKKTTSGGSPRQKLMPATDLVPSLLIAAYIAVDFIPGSNTADVMGNQWLYLAVINLAAILFLSVEKRTGNLPAIKNFLQSSLSILYGALFVLAGISVFFAINRTESLVCYARFTNTLVMYLALAILLYGRTNLFKLLAQVLSFILLIQSLGTVLEFFKRSGDTDISTLIYSLKGNAANKNIFAASLVLKLPFTIYCICYSKTWSRIIHVLVLASGTLAIFILNARSAYLGVIAELMVFLVLFSAINYKKETAKQIFSRLAMVVLPVILSFFLSLVIIKNAISLQEQKTPYGTVIERLGSISLTAEGSNARLSLWSSALDYIRYHPLKGAGYGNWKLASIPYEKTFVDDLLVSYHAHNDFLEITAETGIPGGLLFLSIFICVAVYSLKALFSKNSGRDPVLPLFSLMGMVAYGVDAFFNFPMERPIMQFFFALLLALSLNGYLATKKTAESGRVFWKRIVAPGALILLLPAMYISFLTYKSLIAQTKVNRDMMSDKPVTTWPEISDAFPSLPNINMYCFPIGHIKAFYLMQDKKYDEALVQINQSAGANPYLTLTEYLKAKIFLATNKMDSAFIYASRAFFNKPRARSNYEILNDVSSRLNDTATLTTAFKEYTHYRNEPWAWNRYLDIMMPLLKNRQPLLVLADSAVKLFPADTILQQKRNTLANTDQSSLITKSQEDEFRNYFATGLEAFNKKIYSVAIENFTRAAAANPGDYVAVENTGVCYFSMGNYSKAISFFDKVLKRNISTDGKSEFLKGVCLLNLAKKQEGCYYLKIATGKHYSGAVEYMQSNCK